jgi:hypothetical protein
MKVENYEKISLNKSNCLCNNMKDQVYKQGKICKNEEEKRERYLAAQHRYAAKPWTCDCGRTILKGNKTNHLKSKIHLLRLSQ